MEVKIKMEKMQFNETPVRTSKNFNINHIQLENIELPETIQQFENVEIIGETSNIKIEKQIETGKIKYGISEVLFNQIQQQANQKLKLIVEAIDNPTVKLNFTFDDTNITLIDQIEIVAKEGTKATIIIQYLSKEQEKAFHNGLINIFMKKNANINLTVVNLTNTNTNHFLSRESHLEKQAVLNETIIDFGGKNSITNHYSCLEGESAANQLNTLYLGTENQLFDLNYISDLKGEKADMNIEVQGALKGNSRKHFKGTIDFKKGCKKAKGNENEACMLLSDKAKSISLPMLLCSEEEVEGNHSHSAGKIEEKELFYIMSRGFSKNEAMKLIVKARFNAILENIPDEEIKGKMIEEIDRRLA